MKWLVLLFLIVTIPAIAAIDAYPFPNEQLRERYRYLIAELRCPQCLNTNLAGSDAMIAQDLRREVHRLLLDGKTDDEILTFMHERYGDFILYKPQVKPGTILLWFGPALFAAIAMIVVFVVVRRRRAIRVQTLDGEDRQRLDALLNRK